MAKAPRTRTQDDIVDEFVTAAWQDETDLIDQLAARYPFLVDPAQPYLVKALHTACNACQQNSAQQLVEKHGADVNKIVNGINALHEAMGACDMVTAKMLLRNGADVNMPTQTTEGFVDGWTPLHFAVSSRDTEMIIYLINHGADPLAKEKDGLTVANFARRDKRDDLATIIDRLTPPPAAEPRATPKRAQGGPKI